MSRSTRRSILVLALIGVPYFATAILVSSRRHLWNDELFTYHFARLPDLASLWRELQTGVEQTPPFFYVVTRASLAAFGSGTIAIRLPAIIGVFVACCCIFAVVARRTTVAGGAVAALIVLSTAALPYGYEARPYGLVLGLAGIALLCWQLRADTGGPLAAVGVAVALAGAVSSHYYAVLLVIPLGAAELARTVARRRADPLLLAALAAGLSPLLAYEPLIHGARGFSNSFWTTSSLSQSWTFYAWLLRTPAVPPWIPTRVLVGFSAVVVAGALVILTRVAARPGHGRSERFTPEVGAAIGFLLLPLVSVVLAVTVTGAFTERYALPAVFGAALLVPLATDRLRPRLPLVQVGLAVVLGIFFVRACVYDLRDVTPVLDGQRAEIAFLQQANPRMRIAVAAPHDFLELSQYAPGPLRVRLVYLASRRLSRRYLDTDSTEEGLVVMSRFAPLHVTTYGEGVRHRPLLVFSNRSAAAQQWLLRALARDRQQLRQVASRGELRLYLLR